jgi:predicted CoA-binding protein
MANEQDVADILASARSIAVVGASADPSRDSHRAVSYLLAAGFEVTAVNPKVNEVLGQKSYASLLEVATQIDTVVCFRRSDEILPIAQQAISIGAQNLWMQLGVVNQEARALAEAAGLRVVMNRCIMVDHAHARYRR